MKIYIMVLVFSAIGMGTIFPNEGQPFHMAQKLEEELQTPKSIISAIKKLVDTKFKDNPTLKQQCLQEVKNANESFAKNKKRYLSRIEIYTQQLKAPNLSQEEQYKLQSQVKDYNKLLEQNNQVYFKKLRNIYQKYKNINPGTWQEYFKSFYQ